MIRVPKVTDFRIEDAWLIVCCPRFARAGLRVTIRILPMTFHWSHATAMNSQNSSSWCLLN